jgi:hypothetical protein
MIKDPFIIEQILLDHYNHLGKWYRVEDSRFEDDVLDVYFTFSSLDGHDFGRMSITLNYNKESIDKIMSMSQYVSKSYSLVDDCLVRVWGLDGVLTTFQLPLFETIGHHLKQYSRDVKIDELLQ